MLSIQLLNKMRRAIIRMEEMMAQSQFDQAQVLLDRFLHAIEAYRDDLLDDKSTWDELEQIEQALTDIREDLQAHQHDHVQDALEKILEWITDHAITRGEALEAKKMNAQRRRHNGQLKRQDDLDAEVRSCLDLAYDRVLDQIARDGSDKKIIGRDRLLPEAKRGCDSDIAKRVSGAVVDRYLRNRRTIEQFEDYSGDS